MLPIVGSTITGMQRSVDFERLLHSRRARIRLMRCRARSLHRRERSFGAHDVAPALQSERSYLTQLTTDATAVYRGTLRAQLRCIVTITPHACARRAAYTTSFISVTSHHTSPPHPAAFPLPRQSLQPNARSRAHTLHFRFPTGPPRRGHTSPLQAISKACALRALKEIAPHCTSALLTLCALIEHTSECAQPPKVLRRPSGFVKHRAARRQSSPTLHLVSTSTRPDHAKL